MLYLLPCAPAVNTQSPSCTVFDRHLRLQIVWHNVHPIGGFSSSPVVVRCASLFIGQAASYGTECRTHPDPSMGLYFYVKIRISDHFIRQLQSTLKTLFPQVVEY